MTLSCGLNRFGGTGVGASAVAVAYQNFFDAQQSAQDAALRAARRDARQQQRDAIGALGGCPTSCSVQVIRRGKLIEDSGTDIVAVRLFVAGKTVSRQVCIGWATADWSVTIICKQPNTPTPPVEPDPPYELECGGNDYEDYVVGVGSGNEKVARQLARRNAIAAYKVRVAELKALTCPGSCPRKGMRKIYERLEVPALVRHRLRIEVEFRTRYIYYWVAVARLSYEYIITCDGG